ncbi:MAG: 3D domain-containing protein [Clostridiales bacterium]|nr:3D domain-containing protein [Clostridiales bacterium]
MRNFIVNYFKRNGVLAGVLSVVCVIFFFMAIIPANAVLSSGTFSYTQKYVGGINVERTDMNVAHDASIPRNADGERLVRVGNFKVTHYCACTICTWGSGITASGKPVRVGMIASDWRVLPKGTTVYVQRGDTLLEKVVEDRGGAIQGNIIDIYVESHYQALQLGVYYADLYVDPGTEMPER